MSRTVGSKVCLDCEENRAKADKVQADLDKKAGLASISLMLQGWNNFSDRIMEVYRSEL